VADKEFRDRFLKCSAILTDTMKACGYGMNARLGRIKLGADALGDEALAGLLVWPCIRAE